MMKNIRIKYEDLCSAEISHGTVQPLTTLKGNKIAWTTNLPSVWTARIGPVPESKYKWYAQ